MKESYREYEYTKMPFGKHKGVFIKDLPLEYVKWCILNIKDIALAGMFKIELQRRDTTYRK